MGKLLVIALAAIALVAAGCGGDDDNGSDNSSGAQGNNSSETGSSGGGASSGGGGASSSLKLTADPGGALKFDKTQLNAKAGKVTITMDNPSSTPHAVEVEGKGVEEESKTLTQGSAKLTVDLKPGKYEFYCPVDGHKDAGMKGTLTVQ